MPSLAGATGVEGTPLRRTREFNRTNLRGYGSAMGLGDEQDVSGRVLESNDGAAVLVCGTSLRIDGGGTAQ